MRTLHEALAQQLERDRRYRAAVARAVARRQAIKKLKEDIEALQQMHAEREARLAAPVSNGHANREVDEDAVTNAIPVRKPEGWYQGQPFYRDEEG